MKICCAKTRDLSPKIVNQTHFIQQPLKKIFCNVVVEWIERAEAEKNCNYKQLIPYCVFVSADKKIACYPRHGSENRLHGLYSCGIGGHIEETDKSEYLEDTIQNGLVRELSEEIKDFKRKETRLKYCGIINEVENEVGLVHLGIVYVAFCKLGYTPLPANELTGLEWKTLEELRQINTELWSQLVIDHIGATIYE